MWLPWPFSVLYSVLVDIQANQARILAVLNQQQQQEIKMATTLADILTSVQDEKTVDDSIVTLVTNLKTQIDALLAGGLSPAQQAQVDAIFAQVAANKKEVADAVTANTPSG